MKNKNKKKNIFGNDLKIDQQFINDELSRQPILYHKYAKLAERALSKAKEEELELERIYGNLDLKYRELKAKETKYRITDRAIESMIKRNKKYRQQLKKLVHANYVAGCFKSSVKAFDQRNQMLIQISSNKRQEKKMMNRLNKDEDDE